MLLVGRIWKSQLTEGVSYMMGGKRHEYEVVEVGGCSDIRHDSILL